MAILTNYIRTLDEDVLRLNNSLLTACFSWILIWSALIASSRRPELWNHQGSILRSYFASWIGVFTFIVIRGWLIFNFGLDGLNIHFAAFIDFGVWYFSTATLLWLNMMIYDTWMTFGTDHHNQDLIINNKSRISLFVLRSIYVWGLSGLEIPITIYTTYSPMWTGTNAHWMVLTISRVFVFIYIVMCNMTLIISTAEVIEEREHDLPVANDLDEFHRKIETWVTFCTGLFLLTIIYEISAIPMLFNASFFDYGTTLETLHGIPIFLMFV